LFEIIMRNDWRLIWSGAMTGAENMAQDEALLESVAAGQSEPVLRIYRWAPATVTLGYGQRGGAVVNLEACRKLGLDVVRRCTGGRAVLHDQELTYAVISRDTTAVFPGGILNNYRIIAQVLQRTMEQLGLDVTLASDRSRGSRGDGAEKSACFTAPGQFELLFKGCKLAGCAQKRMGDSFLQHGSVPVQVELDKLFLALNNNPDLAVTDGVELLAKYVGWINRWLDVPITIDVLEQNFVAQFSALLGVEFREDQLTRQEQERSAGIFHQRHAHAAWTLRGLES
jgi:lipoyl(octanoyl) transferase